MINQKKTLYVTSRDSMADLISKTILLETYSELVLSCDTLIFNFYLIG